IFQAMFALEQSSRREEITALALSLGGHQIEIRGLCLESFPLEMRLAHCDLTLMLAEAEGALGASWQYNADLFDAETIDGLAERFGVLVEGILAAPEERISTLPLLTAPER